MAASNQLGCTTANAQPATSINRVGGFLVCLNVKLDAKPASRFEISAHAADHTHHHDNKIEKNTIA
ncbi:hypothetical protein EON66_12150 [archaeon]|nr:MAG: hypothetical protein EON66_12150 [archaeon]